MSLTVLDSSDNLKTLVSFLSVTRSTEFNRPEYSFRDDLCAVVWWSFTIWTRRFRFLISQDLRPMCRSQIDVLTKIIIKFTRSVLFLFYTDEWDFCFKCSCEEGNVVEVWCHIEGLMSSDICCFASCWNVLITSCCFVPECSLLVDKMLRIWIMNMNSSLNVCFCLTGCFLHFHFHFLSLNVGKSRLFFLSASLTLCCSVHQRLEVGESSQLQVQQHLTEGFTLRNQEENHQTKPSVFATSRPQVWSVCVSTLRVCCSLCVFDVLWIPARR